MYSRLLKPSNVAQVSWAIVIRVLCWFMLLQGQAVVNAQDNLEQRENHKRWQEDLNVALEVLSREYAYQEVLSLDWNRIGRSYQKQLVTVKTKREFFELIEQLAEEAHDHHLHLNQNNRDSYRLVPSGLPMWIEFRDGQYVIENVNAFSQQPIAAFRDAAIQSINGVAMEKAVQNRLKPFVDQQSATAKSWAARTLVAGRHRQDSIQLDVQTSAGDSQSFMLKLGDSKSSSSLLTYEKIGDCIAYIRIENSLGQSDLIREFDRVIDKLGEDQSLILDLRNTPSGGNSHVARGLMGRFVFSVQPYQRHEYAEQPFEIPRIWVEHVAPRGKFFDGKIVVLVDRWTGSMGEGIAIGLDGMKRATVIGTRMAGLKGATQRFDLPHSKIGIYVPTQRLFHVGGKPRENYQPTIDVGTSKNVDSAHDDPLVAAALKILHSEPD